MLFATFQHFDITSRPKIVLLLGMQLHQNTVNQMKVFWNTKESEK